LPAVEPKHLQTIPDSVLADVKLLLQKYPSILRIGDVKPTPTHGVEHHIHTPAIPQFFLSPAALIQKNLRLPKQNSNDWNPLAMSIIQNHHGPLLCAWSPKKMDHGGLVAIIAI
jgi:hypothetical protein